MGLGRLPITTGRHVGKSLQSPRLLLGEMASGLTATTGVNLGKVQDFLMCVSEFLACCMRSLEPKAGGKLCGSSRECSVKSTQGPALPSSPGRGVSLCESAPFLRTLSIQHTLSALSAPSHSHLLCRRPWPHFQNHLLTLPSLIQSPFTWEITEL